MGHRFDELAKGLAAGGSRRQALRWIGGLFGGLLAFTAVGKASAEDDGFQAALDKVCNHFCHQQCTGDSCEDNCESCCKNFFNSPPACISCTYFCSSPTMAKVP